MPKTLRRDWSTAGHALVLAALLHAGDLPAYSEVRFERLSVEQGLSQSAVQALASDSDGYLWIGTQFALDRFDGYDFRAFRPNPGVADHLQDGVILSLLVARDGQVWAGTLRGLERIDPTSGRIRSYQPPGENHRALHVAPLVEGSEGSIYAGTAHGPMRASPDSEQLQAIAFAGEVPPPGGPMRLLVDASGVLWLAQAGALWRWSESAQALVPVVRAADDGQARTQAGGLVEWGGRIVHGNQQGLHLVAKAGHIERHIRPSAHGMSADTVDNLAVDAEGALWLLLPGAIARLGPDLSEWRTLAEFAPPNSEQGDHRPFHLATDSNGFAWLAGQFGLGLYRDGYPRIRWLQHDPADPRSLGPTTAGNGYTMLIDRDGTLWVGGGLGGLSRFSPQSARFQVLRVDDGSQHNIVRGIVEQQAEHTEFLWVGYDAAGVRQFQREADGSYRLLHRYHTRAPASRRLPRDNVWGLALDPRGHGLWIANHQQLTMVDTREAEVAWQGFPAGDAVAPVIESLRFARDGSSLWAATSSGLIELGLDPGRTRPTPRRRWTWHVPGDPGRPLRVIDLFEADDGRWLLATEHGLGLVDPATGEQELIALDPAAGSRPSPRNHLYGLAEEPAGTWWLGTRGGGLARMIPGRAAQDPPEIRWYSRNQGLADDTIYAILPDAHGHLWLSSNRGLMRFDPDEGQVQPFGPRDGLQDHEYNNTVAHIGASGRFYFGGINGLNLFRPEQIATHRRPPRVRMQELRIGERVQPLAIPTAPELTLAHHENELTIGYLALHSQDPSRVRYAYRMQGIDSNWVDAGTLRQVRYPQLPPGDYQFWLRAANPDGLWSEPRLLLQTTIRSPPWRSGWAYAGYLLLAALGVGLILLEQQRRNRRLKALVAERTRELAQQKDLVDAQAAALAEALEARTQLFANVSHELRTPLTLIQATLDRAERQGADTTTIGTGRRYLQRLMRLVDQLLELSRLRSLPVADEAATWALDVVVATVSDSFRALVEQRGIQLRIEVEAGWRCRAQQQQVERILLNLLGNAAKFTPDGGHIEVSLHGHGDKAELVVADNGPGIPTDQQALIFERYHRTPSAEHSPIIGAGIGLALVREAALANGGSVALVSQPGQGSRFCVQLPAWRESGPASADAISGARVELELATLAGIEQQPTLAEAPHRRHVHGNLLIVEDNSDLRAYLAQALLDDWRILEAANGNEALDLARKRSVDIVLSDIMMPGMDGIALLKALREDLRTSHLPVLLLTARQDEETRFQGLRLAADEFLVKPFDLAELKLRLARIIGNRQRLQAHLLGLRHRPGAVESTENTGTPGESIPGISSRDQRFLDRLHQWLEAHYTNPDLEVEAMAGAVAMDLRTLQRKLKALTGRTPNAYLRDHRLAHARRLLRETDRQVTDIALSCGFNSVQYFSRVFHKAEDEAPESWRRLRRS